MVNRAGPSAIMPPAGPTVCLIIPTRTVEQESTPPLPAPPPPPPAPPPPPPFSPGVAPHAGPVGGGVGAAVPVLDATVVRAGGGQLTSAWVRIEGRHAG